MANDERVIDTVPHSPNEKSSVGEKDSQDFDYGFKEKVVESQNSFADGSDIEVRNGEPIVNTGKDVSRFVVDIRDDGDDALTFRSLVLGTLFAGLGSALCQVGRFIFCLCRRSKKLK